MSTHQQFCRQFSLDEIKTASSNFSDELIIGRGGFGNVYRGVINNGAKVVAIKRLSSESKQGELEFSREIQTLYKVQHHNIVCLEGYCDESPEKILIYEYMPYGSLQDHLYKFKLNADSATNIRDNQPHNLTWFDRLNISIGAAQGLDFLHRGVVPGVIHRDIKDSNILLDSNLRAKIADFGLAKLVKNDSKIPSASTTLVRGTIGFLDPEYYFTEILTTKTDVYAFGVVLLVLLSGRPAVDTKVVEDERSLAGWATKCIAKKRLDLVIDPDLDVTIASKSLQQFVKIVQKCLRKSEQRPTMKEVVAGLQSALKKQPGSTSSLTHRAAWLNAMFDIQKKNPSASLGIQKQSSGIPQFKGATSYSFEELKKCTNNFSDFNDISSGGYGKVYEGTLPNGQWIAIKRAQQGSLQGELDFKNQIELLSRVHHENVVSLLGVCFDKEEQMLVYEYIPNGTLKDSLSGKSGILLDWMTRLKIALGTAKGIQYLHGLADPPIIHRNIKSANILLDYHLNAKVTDFGLSVRGETLGITGYLDPEYYVTQELTEKSDVYSFGVSLLELVTARILTAKGKNIVRKVKQTMNKKKLLYNLQGILDPNLELSMSAKSLEQFVDLAFGCVEEAGANRPSMAKVVKQIESIMEVAGLNAESATTFENYDPSLRMNMTRLEWRTDKEVLDDIIRRLLEGKEGKRVRLPEAEIRLLCVNARQIFLSELSLLEVQAPITICGDIHGQYQDLLRIFEIGGFPPSAAYLFLGNYVDFGRQSLETMCLLLAYKILYPDKVLLLRWKNDANRNQIYDECRYSYNVGLWKTFRYCFNCLPVAALVGDKIFCMHGGLTPDLKEFKGGATNIHLLEEIKVWAISDRGVPLNSWPHKVSNFLQINDLDLSFRGNPVWKDGYEFFAERGRTTTFSAPKFNNAGAVLTVDKSMMCAIEIFGMPSLTQMATGWNVKFDTQKKNPSASWGTKKHSDGIPQIKGAISYSFEELKKCTNNFSEFNDIGSGGFEKVYKGTLPNGQLVAIKRAQQGSMQGALEFTVIIELLSSVHHKNVVSLLGYCIEKEEQMLVYEYLKYGTLRDSLSGKSGILLDWMRRVTIALGTAKGIQYLHDLSDPLIIHRIVKSTNILLDDHLTAKVADFCLSVLVGETQVMSTMGYLGPDYYMTQQLTGKSDVYSFGVSLLELVTARAPIEKGKYIVKEVKQTMDKMKVLYNLQGILDPNLDLSMPAKSLERFVDLALRCVEEGGANPPSMAEVVKEIESIMELAGLNVESVTTLENYGGASNGYPCGKNDFSLTM